VTEVKKNLTPTEIHKKTDVPIRTISQWQSQKIIPKSAEIGDIIKAILAHKDKRIEELIESRNNNSDDELTAANIALRWEQYRKEKLANDEKEGTLVLASEVGMVWAKVIMAIKLKLSVIPAKMAYRLLEQTNYQTVKGLLDQEIQEVSSELGSDNFADSVGNSEADSDLIDSEA